MTAPNAFGEWLARQRAARRWTQAELEERAGVADCVSRYERGVRKPTDHNLSRLEGALGAKYTGNSDDYLRCGLLIAALKRITDLGGESAKIAEQALLEHRPECSADEARDPGGQPGAGCIVCGRSRFTGHQGD